MMGTTVIYVKPGDIGHGDVGTVVECDDEGRDRLVRFRNGVLVWVRKEELAVIDD